MKEEELRKWLLSLDSTEDSEEIVAWIMEALRMLHLTIDVDGDYGWKEFLIPIE